MNFKAVIFDMDGTLIDSEAYWPAAEANFLRNYNITFTPEQGNRYMGRSQREIATMIKTEFNLPYSVDELLRAKNSSSEFIYTEKSKALPGADVLIRRVRDCYRTAIASGSSLERIETILNRLQWKEYFDVLVSCDEVDYKGKPDPAVYVYTAEKLGLSPSECIVVEDSHNGVLSAKAAGMTCIAVPNERTHHTDRLADYYVSSLIDPEIEKILGL